MALFACSCQKNEIVVSPAQLATVKNLNYTLTGDTVLLTWANPDGVQGVVPTISSGASSAQLASGATSYKFGIIETNKQYGFTIKLNDTKGNTSLGQTVRFTRDGAYPVKNVGGLQNDNGVLLTWATPDGPVTKITIKFGSQTVDLAAGVTSYQFNNVPAGLYIISFVTANAANQLSNTVYLPFKVGATIVGYLSEYSDSATMIASGDDDQVAGAKWLFSNYPKARFIPFSQVKSGTVDLTQIRVLWWNYDVETGHALPPIATDADVVAKITQFHKNGGNLLLNQYAMQYLWNIGRITAPYFTGFDDGAGGYNPDTWGIGVNIHQKHDQSGHPLYKGIAMTTQGDGRITFPVIGAGWKENHNAVILRIPEYYGGLPNDSETAYTKFTTDNNSEWLGMWDGIGDYWMCGIMELKPKDDYQGSALFIGIGGIEWHQNTGNTYQANIEKLYQNAIEYLKTK